MIHILERLKVRAQKGTAEEKKAMLDVYEKIKSKYFGKPITYIALHEVLSQDFPVFNNFDKKVEVQTLMEILFHLNEKQ